MLKKELIGDIRELLRDYSYDSEVSDRHIMFLTRTKRNKYLRQREIKNLGEYRDQYQQTIYMTLELVDRSDFSGVTTGGTILRTVKSLPNIVGRNLFKNLEVRTVDLIGKEIQVVSKERALNIAYAPEGFIYCFKYEDGKLYFVAKDSIHKTLQKVVVKTILEDPEDIVELNDMTSSLEDYPITGDVWEIIRYEILQDLLREKSIPIDTLNNNADDVTTAQK